MPDLRVRDLTWQPVGRRTPVLPGLDLDVPAGQHVLLAGPSGSGKSTLLRALAGVLQGNESGTYVGSVTFGGADPRESGGVGLLVQDPADAVVARRAGRDVAFGLENLGVPRAQLWPRVRAALAAVRFPYDEDHAVAALSGGERQRLALAGVVVLRPGLLLLDEPTAMLDPVTAAQVREQVLRVAAEAGATTVVVEHRMEGWYAPDDRLVVLGRDGAVVADGPVGATLQRHAGELARQGVWVPGLPAPAPVAVPAWLVSPLREARGAVAAESVSVRRGERTALSAVSARLESGRALAVRGASGAGKSTLLLLLGGLLAPSSGTVAWSPSLARGLTRPPHRWRAADLARRVGYVPQHAEHGMVRHEVREDVLATGRALGHPEGPLAERVDGLLAALGLAELARANPFRLSGGEQRRLTLATALAHGPDVLLLDEPTVGQDRLTWAAVTGVVRAASGAGAAVALATHDDAAVRATADRVLALDGGVAMAPDPRGTAGCVR